MAARFRDLPKQPITVFIPGKLIKRIRHESVDREISIAATVSQILCEGLKINPAQFGLDAPERQESSN